MIDWHWDDGRCIRRRLYLVRLVSRTSLLYQINGESWLEFCRGGTSLSQPVEIYVIPQSVSVLQIIFESLLPRCFRSEVMTSELPRIVLESGIIHDGGEDALTPLLAKASDFSFQRLMISVVS